MLLSLVGVAVVLLSLGASLFCLRVVLGGTWISIYVFPSVYIAIGVGADDLFFIAAWYDERTQDAGRRGGGGGGGGGGGAGAAAAATAVRRRSLRPPHPRLSRG